MSAARPPGVERLLAQLRPSADGRAPEALRDAARAAVAAERGRLATGAAPRSVAALVEDATARLAQLDAGVSPQPGINATGVLIHTNLGRATWPAAAIRAAEAAASAPLLLE